MHKYSYSGSVQLGINVNDGDKERGRIDLYPGYAINAKDNLRSPQGLATHADYKMKSMDCIRASGISERDSQNDIIAGGERVALTNLTPPPLRF